MCLKNLGKTGNIVCNIAENINSCSRKVKRESKEKVKTTPEINKQSCDNNNMENSSDMFPEQSVDSTGNSSKIANTAESSNSEELDQLSSLNRMPDCSLPLPKLKPSENHTILFSVDICPPKVPSPYPTTYTDKWDSDHVRMPCSTFNTYPVDASGRKKHIENKWDVICKRLRSDIKSSQDLEEVIMSYNSEHTGKWNFLGLHDFINRILTEEERNHFFEDTLPAMIEIALDLPNICTQPVPLLKKDHDHYVTISQKQIGCLLLNAFFCTFPRRNLPHKKSKQRLTCEFGTYPDINFSSLFYGTKDGIPNRYAEKLKCLLNYFQRITSEEPTGTVTFHRQSLQNEDFPEWHASMQGIKYAVIESSGLIESDGFGMLQVDFADKFVGGLILRQGCVQEEIRFVICPELIVSCLFVERLGDNEVLIVTGVEQYNKYSGYADRFKWEGNFKDKTPRDSWGRRYAQLVAMDATYFRNRKDQYKLQFIKRELNKAYCAFYENSPPAHLPSVATGNWGCGIFKGNPNLKFLIQLMAASQAGRGLLYFTFGNKKLEIQLRSMYEFLKDKKLTVGNVWQLLVCYAEDESKASGKGSDLYDFIYNQFSTEKRTVNEKKLKKVVKKNPK